MNDDLPQTATVTLDQPIPRGETTIKAVILRKPLGRALKGVAMLGLAQMDYDEVKKVLPRISDPTLTAADVDGMDPADIFSCGVEIGTFLAGSKVRTDSPPT